jgi:hypothetical protein
MSSRADIDQFFELPFWAKSRPRGRVLSEKGLGKYATILRLYPMWHVTVVTNTTYMNL